MTEQLEYVMAIRILALRSTEHIIVQQLNGLSGERIEAAYCRSIEGVGKYVFCSGQIYNNPFENRILPIIPPIVGGFTYELCLA